MADLGTIASWNRRNRYAQKLSVWQATHPGLGRQIAFRNVYFRYGSTPYQGWAGTTNVYMEVPNLGSFSGSVTENGAAVPNAVVFVFERKTGLCVGRVLTNAYGLFTTKAIYDKSANNYFVVALDPDGGVMYNALIYDRLTPV